MKGRTSIMNIASPIHGDRWSGTALAIVAALNTLFLTAFLATLLFSVSRAQGAETTCAGQDMIAQFARDRPAVLEKARSQAEAVANGQGLLWRIEKAGAPASHLFGTMHMTDPRLLALDPAVRAAFDEAATVVIETTDILDQSKVMAAFAERPELTMFTDGQSLETILPAGEIDNVRQALDRRGIPFSSVRLMKPWMLSAVIALPACELARKNGGAPVLDQKLAEDAEAAGKALGGLETINDQLGAMASLPMDFHIKSLVETLKLGDRVDDIIETMVRLYLRGETGMFVPFFRAVLPSAGDGTVGYAAFEQTMIVARNHVMAERAVPFLDKGDAFIAVGALHLPGDEGVIELLRAKGYSVEPAQ